MNAAIRWALLIAAAIVIALALLCAVMSCETDGQAPRITPTVYWAFESPEGVPSLDVEYREAFSSVFIRQGEIVTLPFEWQAFPFLVPRRMVTVPYEFQWRPAGEEWATLAIATVDSMQSGIVWFVGKGIEKEDQVRLNLPWEGYQ